MQSEASITAKAQITDNWGPEVNLTGQIARSILGPRMWVDGQNMLRLLERLRVWASSLHLLDACAISRSEAQSSHFVLRWAHSLNSTLF